MFVRVCDATSLKLATCPGCTLQSPPLRSSVPVLNDERLYVLDVIHVEETI